MSAATPVGCVLLRKLDDIDFRIGIALALGIALLSVADIQSNLTLYCFSNGSYTCAHRASSERPQVEMINSRGSLAFRRPLRTELKRDRYQKHQTIALSFFHRYPPMTVSNGSLKTYQRLRKPIFPRKRHSTVSPRRRRSLRCWPRSPCLRRLHFILIRLAQIRPHLDGSAGEDGPRSFFALSSISSGRMHSIFASVPRCPWRAERGGLPMVRNLEAYETGDHLRGGDE